MNDPACDAFRRRFLVDLASSPSIRTVFLAGRWAPLVSGTVPETGGTLRTFLKDDATTALSPQETLRSSRTLARSHDPGRCARWARRSSSSAAFRSLASTCPRYWRSRATTAWGMVPANTIGRARVADAPAGTIPAAVSKREGATYIPLLPPLCAEGLRTVSRPDAPSTATATTSRSTRRATSWGSWLKNAGLQRVASARNADQ